MNPGRESRQYILDMLDATTKALAFVKGIEKEEFLDNEEKIFAVIHALERIGEAAKHVPAGIKRSIRMFHGDRLRGLVTR